MVPVNILGDGYPNKTIGYLNIIIKCVMFTSHTVIIPDKELVTTSTSTSVVTTSFEYHSKSAYYKNIIYFKQSIFNINNIINLVHCLQL